MIGSRALIVLASLLLVLFTSAPAAAQPAGSAGFSVDLEGLVWWLKDSPQSTPLVSTGILGTPGTSVILGNRDIDTAEFPGGRITIGLALRF